MVALAVNLFQIWNLFNGSFLLLLTCIVLETSDEVINCRFLGNASELGKGLSFSIGGARNVNTLFSLQFAVTVKDSMVRNFGPLNVSLTNDSTSKHIFSHDPGFRIVSGNFACKGVIETSLRFEENNIRRLFWVWSVTVTSNENGRPTGRNIWNTRNFLVKNSPCLSSSGNCILVVVGSPSKM